MLFQNHSLGSGVLIAVELIAVSCFPAARTSKRAESLVSSSGMRKESWRVGPERQSINHWHIQGFLALLPRNATDCSHIPAGPGPWAGWEKSHAIKILLPFPSRVQDIYYYNYTAIVKVNEQCAFPRQCPQ